MRIRMSCPGFVYLARLGCRYKIGASANPVRRVASLNDPDGKPELIHSIPARDYAWVRLRAARFRAEANALDLKAKWTALRAAEARRRAAKLISLAEALPDRLEIFYESVK